MGNTRTLEHGPNGSDLIEVLPMPLSVEARGCEDDWTGCSSQTVRRKLQNRLNQRASRRRRGLTSANPVRGPRDIQEERTSELNASLSRVSRPDLQCLNSGLAVEVFDQVLLPNPAYRAPISYCPSVEVHEPRGRSEECMARPYLASIVYAINFTTWIVSRAKREPSFDFYQFSHPISADHLLTLTLFNLVRGLTTNIISLGLDPRLMHTDIPSPFVSTPLSSRLPNQALCLPPMLRPTLLQQTISHHPEIDVLPFPKVRDNVILAAGDYDEVELCMNILGLDRTASSLLELDRETDTARTGLLVWGEPSLPGSWEVSEGFATKWQWLLCGSTDLLHSTNYWRERRGEPPLLMEM